MKKLLVLLLCLAMLFTMMVACSGGNDTVEKDDDDKKTEEKDEKDSDKDDPKKDESKTDTDKPSDDTVGTELSDETLEGYWVAKADFFDMYMTMYSAVLGVDVEADVDPINLYFHFEDGKVESLMITEQILDIVPDLLSAMVEASKKADPSALGIDEEFWQTQVDEMEKEYSKLDSKEAAAQLLIGETDGVFFKSDGNDSDYSIEGDKVIIGDEETGMILTFENGKLILQPIETDEETEDEELLSDITAFLEDFEFTRVTLEEIESEFEAVELN